jgi:VanZ family protein
MKIKKNWLMPLLIFYWVLCFALTHLPLPSEVAPRPGMDKVYHLVGYFFLGLLLKSNFSIHKKFITYQIRACLVFVLIYSIFDEATQPFVGRQFDLLDIASDIIGATLGALASQRIYPVK